jgi:hypothetical protein
MKQLTRCGPEAFLRKMSGVQGRQTHDKVNPFERGSAGGHRLDLTALDLNTGGEVSRLVAQASACEEPRPSGAVFPKAQAPAVTPYLLNGYS